MNVVSGLVQGSQEWLDFRRTRITATEFAVVAANKKYCKNIFSKSVKRLIKEKVESIQIPDNKYFFWGRHYEPIISAEVEGISITPGEIITYGANDRIMASLDAYDSVLERVIEIKTTSKDEEKLDEILDFYKFQLLHQMYCAGTNAGVIAIGFLDEEFNLKKTIQRDYKTVEILDCSKWLELCSEFLILLDEGLNEVIK